jgi:hypothetical protein
LPGITVAHTAAPEDAIIRSGNDDPDVQPKTLFVNNSGHKLLKRAGFAVVTAVNPDARMQGDRRCLARTGDPAPN